MVCTSDYDPEAGNMLDEYFPLVVLDLSSNNLNGELFDELYGFERLERLSFRSNGGVSGNISSSIGELSTTLVELVRIRKVMSVAHISRKQKAAKKS